ncbi:hypothetical protein BDY21DRAFT_287634 [Lineolata rhizophorae]|uniref:Integral membrane protein n=1 Tax=Lineolata rhizophorae TaxID=578093 RepID=A0A6A6NXT2_9PEZI|nr:hypothetical protein BDY21DRAFT_287634 [Lineolata rhizophorae]
MRYAATYPLRSTLPLQHPAPPDQTKKGKEKKRKEKKDKLTIHAPGNSFTERLSSPAPLDYEPPSFPSLYWPFPVLGTQAYYLYHPYDVWRFTLLWTLLFYGGVHLAASGFAVGVQWRRNWKAVWLVPVLYAGVAGIEALIAGSVVGGLGGVYTAGYFRMSTWIPFVWAFISTLVLILSSFAIQGGL